MKVLLVNPPYQTITSNMGVGHQVPLGLLMIGGALRDDGHEVKLLDAECRRMRVGAIVDEVRKRGPDVIMTGHAGSTPAHPVTMRMLSAIKAAHPQVRTIYGGVYPSYHSAPILAAEPAVDFVVRGEGEATSVALLAALRTNPRLCDPSAIPGAFGRLDGRAVSGPPRPPIAKLDLHRIGWELIERWDDYQCFGLGRAAIIQFSRGCPHQCTYCGQHEFWVKWRHRDPIKVVDEIEFLHRRHRVRFFTLADENPTTLKAPWRQFLEELARRRLDIHFFATIRATDIVRDADILPLYRAAGILYILMGIESTSDDILRQVRKRSTTRHDLLACQLLRRHGIFSVIGHIVGLGQETPAAFGAAARRLAVYDGDWLNAMYVTPHDWTPFGATALSGRPVIESSQAHWDYRHQVLAESAMSPSRLFFSVKWLELRFHLLRPRRLRRLLVQPDALRSRQQWWTLVHIGRVWLAEVAEFLWRHWRGSFARPEAPARGATLAIPVISTPPVSEAPVAARL